MAALSIALVNAKAKTDVSKHLHLEHNRHKGCYYWVFNDGARYNLHRVDVDKIRGLKMVEWIDAARSLVARVEGGEVIEMAKASEPGERELGPMPAFMLIGKSVPPKPFEADPEAQGYNDGCRGITACPYSDRQSVGLWDRGHDRAFGEGLADKPRFSKASRSRR